MAAKVGLGDTRDSGPLFLKEVLLEVDMTYNVVLRNHPVAELRTLQVRLARKEPAVATL